MVPEYQCPLHTLLLVKNDIPDCNQMDKGTVNSWLQLLLALEKRKKRKKKKRWRKKRKKKMKRIELFYGSSIHCIWIQISVQDWWYQNHSLCTSIMFKLSIIFWNCCNSHARTGGRGKGKKKKVFQCSMPHGLFCLQVSETTLFPNLNQPSFYPCTKNYPH